MLVSHIRNLLIITYNIKKQFRKSEGRAYFWYMQWLGYQW